MPEVSLRFSVGDGVTRAATWKCWTSRGSGKNDVYLACRELRWALKASLHASGRWHIAFDQTFLDANAVPEEWPTRFLDSWNRPSELVPGFTLACRIITPYAAVNAGVAPSEAEDTVWIPPPPEGEAVETVVAVTRSEMQVTNWPGKRSMGTQFVGRLDLDNRDVVWVVTRVTSMPALKLSFNRQRFFHGRTSGDVKGPGLRAIVFGSEPDGSRVIYEAVVRAEAFSGPAVMPNY
ncbi:MAG: hypothetical protein ACK5AZ_04210 [Bryobacteraceae bacterium]